MTQSEIIQSYFDDIYKPFNSAMRQSLFSNSNEIYGELYYYSLVKLLYALKLTIHDHFLDIGSGFGKVVFQIFLTTNVASSTGIEINKERYLISQKISENIKLDFPDKFDTNRHLNLMLGDFLNHEFNHITIIYICSTIFSTDLISALGNKINSMKTVQKIISFRKIPNLDNFTITKKQFLHASWDKVACYLYSRKTSIS